MKVAETLFFLFAFAIVVRLAAAFTDSIDDLLAAFTRGTATGFTHA